MSPGSTLNPLLCNALGLLLESELYRGYVLWFFMDPSMSDHRQVFAVLDGVILAALSSLSREEVGGILARRAVILKQVAQEASKSATAKPALIQALCESLCAYRLPVSSAELAQIVAFFESARV